MLKEHLKSRSDEIDKNILEIIPKDITNKWIIKSLGDSKWEYDTTAISQSLSKPIWDLLDRGGKRWRPALMELCCVVVGGSKDDVKDLLGVPELIHNGTLMVDDIEDNSDLRRGKKAIHHIYGNDVAINAGNAMYFLPYLKIRNLDANKKLIIYELIFDELLKLHFGQAKDINWHKGLRLPTTNQYLQMCAFKTGVLARLSAKMGAVLGNANKTQIEALGSFAESIGVAFQIIDDILNIKPGKDWGKDIGDDITEGKITLLVLHSLKNTNNSTKQELLNIIKEHTTDKEKIQRAIDIITKSGSIEYAKEIANKMVKDAWNKIEPILKQSKAKLMLKKFADYLIEREI